MFSKLSRLFACFVHTAQGILNIYKRGQASVEIVRLAASVDGLRLT